LALLAGTLPAATLLPAALATLLPAALATLAGLLLLLARFRALLVRVLVGIGHADYSSMGWSGRVRPNVSQLREPKRVSGKCKKKGNALRREFAGNLGRI
jgi:hypothetical protein